MTQVLDIFPHVFVLDSIRDKWTLKVILGVQGQFYFTCFSSYETVLSSMSNLSQKTPNIYMSSGQVMWKDPQVGINDIYHSSVSAISVSKITLLLPFLCLLQCI